MCGSWFFYVVPAVQERVETNFLERRREQKRTEKERKEKERRIERRIRIRRDVFVLCLLGVDLCCTGESRKCHKYTRISTFQGAHFLV